MKIVAAVVLSAWLSFSFAPTWADEATAPLPGPAVPAYQKVLARQVKIACAATDQKTFDRAMHHIWTLDKTLNDPLITYINGRLLRARPEFIDDRADFALHYLTEAMKRGVLPAVVELARHHEQSDRELDQDDAMAFYLVGRLLGLDHEKKIMTFEQTLGSTLRQFAREDAWTHFVDVQITAKTLWHHPGYPNGERPYWNWPCNDGEVTLERITLPDLSSPDPRARLNTPMNRECGDTDGKRGDVRSYLDHDLIDLILVEINDARCRSAETADEAQKEQSALGVP